MPCYRNFLSCVANCLGKSASFLRFWIAAFLLVTEQDFLCYNTLSRKYAVNNFACWCGRKRFMNTSLFQRYDSFNLSQRLNSDVLHRYRRGTRGSLIVANTNFTQLIAPKLWHLAAFEDTLQSGGFCLFNCFLNWWLWRRSQVSYTADKRYVIPHSTLCPVASFGTTNRNRKSLGALFVPVLC